MDVELRPFTRDDVALLRCAAEGLPASRFAEYLSLVFPAANAEVPIDLTEFAPPSSVGHMMFRLLVGQYARLETTADLDRLEGLLGDMRAGAPEIAEGLRSELDRATIVEPEDMPPGVVTMERMLALTSTSTFGTVYEARPLKEVVHFSATSHESTRALPRSSGSARVRSHVSRTARPVLVPPCKVRPLASRAVPVKSTPCQYDVRASP